MRTRYFCYIVAHNAVMHPFSCAGDFFSPLGDTIDHTYLPTSKVAALGRKARVLWLFKYMQVRNSEKRPLILASFVVAVHCGQVVDGAGRLRRLCVKTSAGRPFQSLLHTARASEIPPCI